MLREVVFDTETTGLDPKQGHRVIEIGCVEIVNKIRTGNHYHCYINPQRDVPAASTAVHGLTEEFLRDKPLFKDVADDFLNFIGSDPLVIHNAAFDMKFINHELQMVNKPLVFPGKVVDTLEMARKKFPGAKANLDALCNRFGIDLSARTKHGALLDAELLADVYLELIGGRQIFMSLEEEKKETKQQKMASKFETKQPKTMREPRHYALTEEEQSLHDAFVGKMKEPIWKG